MENSSDTIGNRTRDLPATAPLRSPPQYKSAYKISNFLGSEGGSANVLQRMTVYQSTRCHTHTHTHTHTQYLCVPTSQPHNLTLTVTDARGKEM